MELLTRPRRLRTVPALREMVRETRISKASLIYPLFVREGNEIREEIPSLEGQVRYSPDSLCFGIENAMRAGVNKIMLFGIPSEKDEKGSEAWNDNGVIQRSLRIAKNNFPELYIVTDVCLCEYTSHGHCGILDGSIVDNDETLKLLAKTALSHVQAGADMVAPSDMMDGRVVAIRRKLDENRLYNTPILSYAAKYASSFYGPFREAAGSAPSFGDRKGYQMDYHNQKEALKEVLLDIGEGADLVMIKPALAYLDIISKVASQVHVPVAAYSVSGEYAMILAATKSGFIDKDQLIAETAVGIYRAGADILITYFAKELAKMMEEGRIG